ncbi:MAG: hypothetical protein WCJ02_14310 [bacterium]
MRRIYVFLLLGFTQICFAEGPVIIPDPRVQAVAVAQKHLLPGLKRAGKSIVEIPWQVGQCFRLPLGLAEVIFSPLPDVEFKEGLDDLGAGVLAPFRFCKAVFEMPYEVYCGLSDAVTLK